LSFNGTIERIARSGATFMKLFLRQLRNNIICFENRTCGRCGHRLACAPELEVMSAREPANGESWTPLAGSGGPRRFSAGTPTMTLAIG